MKKALLISLLSLSAIAQADVVTIKCQMAGLNYVDEFSLKGSVELSDNEFNAGSFIVNFKNKGQDSESFAMDLDAQGVVRTFAAGTLGVDEVIQLESSSKGSEIEHVNLLVGFPGALSSQIRFADGRVYKAKCTK